MSKANNKVLEVVLIFNVIIKNEVLNYFLTNKVSLEIIRGSYELSKLENIRGSNGLIRHSAIRRLLNINNIKQFFKLKQILCF